MRIEYCFKEKKTGLRQERGMVFKGYIILCKFMIVFDNEMKYVICSQVTFILNFSIW